MFLKKFKDFEECSILFYSGLPIVDIERDGNTCWFYFDDKSNEAEDIITDFHNYKIEGNLKKFCDSQQNIRKRFKSV